MIITLVPSSIEHESLKKTECKQSDLSLIENQIHVGMLLLLNLVVILEGSIINKF